MRVFFFFNQLLKYTLFPRKTKLQFHTFGLISISSVSVSVSSTSTRLCLRQHFANLTLSILISFRSSRIKQLPKTDHCSYKFWWMEHLSLPSSIIFSMSLFHKINVWLFSMCDPNLSKFLTDQCESRLNYIHFHIILSIPLCPSVLLIVILIHEDYDEFKSELPDIIIKLIISDFKKILWLIKYFKILKNKK